MRLGILCVGRLKAGPERELYARYAARVAAMRNIGLTGLDLLEIDESRARNPAERMAQEGDCLLAALPAGGKLVVFDERGKPASSADFAAMVASDRDNGVKSLWFAIGGSEGLSPAVREKAGAVFSFGRMTLPHQIVRILVAEQIYRATTILSGHPYHRA
ncbi:23S rRNA (pseudouridine(1915)-N(3))-methyltransferase RlmH [Methylosinus sporium]|uniref:23S rRNA (pseudouridine(1915)-N(3))-methyltransferase RlmH n=1 Tax=Methylosinus sporium TaxID=428 RepID=UPI00383AD7AB